MRLLIQRVSNASVIADGVLTGKIEGGLLIFVGFEESDNDKDIEYAVKKVINLRIFDDPQGVMNLSLLTTGGNILLVSQFTLHASTKKGNRPSYVRSAPAKIAIPLYNSFKEALEKGLNKEVQAGIFGADMKVSLLNDGPVTIWIDTKDR